MSPAVRRHLLLGAAGLAVLVLCGLVAGSGTVGGPERSVFRAVNDLPGWLYRPLWVFQQFGNLFVAVALGVAFALALRRARVAGAVLGAAEIVNPATYWDDQPCRLLRTPLEWLREGIEGCAVILDPVRARSMLAWAPGHLAALDEDHADELVEIGIVDPKRLVLPVVRSAA